MFDSFKQWEDFTKQEIKEATPMLDAHGITLANEQPHISGERFLMSGRKVVLVGHDTNSGNRVIIKTSADPESIKEIEHECLTRNTLNALPFAYQPLLAPQELWLERRGKRIVVAFEYIEQEKPYLSLPLDKQFDFILAAFTMLAGVHATTSTHTKRIVKVFGVWDAADYIQSLQSFMVDIQQTTSNTVYISGVLTQVEREFTHHHEDVERYCRFLTHDDFALHNIRLHQNKIYLIDHASLHFGNKHESWARFMNYMLLYNRDLEKALTKYLELNTATEELDSLRLLRMYKVVELIKYHALAADKADGDVQTLSKRRVQFWTKILQSLFLRTDVRDGAIESYKTERDSLRSDEETKRQQELQQLL